MAPEIPEVALHLSLFDLSLFDLSPFEFLMGENRLPFKGGRVLFQWAVPSLKQLPKQNASEPEIEATWDGCHQLALPPLEVAPASPQRRR